MPPCRLLVLAGLCCLTAGCFAGQRLLEARIEQDGQLLLRTQYSVPDSWDRRAAWGALEGRPFESVGGWQPGPEPGGEVTLREKVRLLLLHAGRPFAAADLRELRLVGDPAAPGRWRLAPGEVRRTREALP